MTNRQDVFRRQALLFLAIWCLSSVTLLAAEPAASPIPQISAVPNNGAAAPSPTPLVAPNPTPESSPKTVGAPNPNASPPPGSPTNPAAADPSPTPSQNAVINLINRLVQRGVLTKDDATELIQQAEADAAKAREDAAKANATPAATPELTQGGLLPPVGFLQTPQPLAENALAPVEQPEEPPPALQAGPDDTVRVTYIPEVVKNQLRDQIKQEVMSEARAENWAAPNVFPSWVSRITLFGDLRLRYEHDGFPAGNDNTGAFPNFNAINIGPPFDTAGTVFPPEINVDKNRERFRIRVRVGLNADLGDGFSIGIRGATGENDSPVTENQSLGVANNGQGGNFSRYAIWLDRAFLKYEIGGQPDKDLTLLLGRFDNPFFATTMLWASDLGFDGIVLKARYQVARGVTPFLTVGAFPVFNTEFNFASTNPAKFNSQDKYLYAIQGGTDWRINRDFHLKVAGAYYDFNNIEGRLSSPFTPLTSSDQGNTDDSRPAFAQNGNTYMALRNIVPTAANNFGQIDQFQYYGLATPFREVAFDGQFDYTHFEPFVVSLNSEWVTNVAFDRAGIANKAVNNRSTSSSGTLGNFEGGNSAWMVNLTAGSVVMQKRWDWNLGIGYRYVESDSLVDGFADSDFGGPAAGTNLKGYTIFGNVALSNNIWLGVRWMSSNEVAGPPLKVDVLQVDVNGRF